VSVRWQKNGSFGFAKRWLGCRAKPNVPFCAVGFFLFVSRCFLHCRLFFRVAANVLQLSEVRNLPAQTFLNYKLD